MAVDAPFGLKIHRAGLDPEDLLECYVPSSDSTILGLGDAVILAGSYDGDGAPMPSRPTVQRASAGDGNAIFGIIEAIDQYKVADANHSLSRRHRPASVGMYVHVRRARVGDIYAIQADGAVAKADVGNKANIATISDANTTTGLSKMELDQSSLATSQTGYQLIVVGFPETADVEYNTANQVVLVEINNIQAFHAFAGV